MSTNMSTTATGISTSTHYVINLTSGSFDVDFLRKNLSYLDSKINLDILSKEQIGLSLSILEYLNDIDYLSDDQMDRLVKSVMQYVDYKHSDLQDGEMLANNNRDNVTVIVPSDALFVAHLAHQIAYQGWQRFSHLNIVIQRLNGLFAINS